MLRSLLTLLAVLVTGLAVLFERPWLYVVTGLIVIGGLGLLGWWLWTAYAGDDPNRPRPSPDTTDADPSLEDFGIVDIKPENAEGEPSPADAQEASPSHPGRDSTASPADAPGSRSTPSSASRGLPLPPRPVPLLRMPLRPMKPQSSPPSSNRCGLRSTPARCAS